MSIDRQYSVENLVADLLFESEFCPSNSNLASYCVLVFQVKTVAPSSFSSSSIW